MIEIFILNLKPGTGPDFHQQYVKKAIPLLKKWNFKVLANGHSLHNENSYYVIRAFESLEQRQKSEDAYYNSIDWLEGPRTTLLDMVENYSTLVVKSESLKTWLELFNQVNE